MFVYRTVNAVGTPKTVVTSTNSEGGTQNNPQIKSRWISPYNRYDRADWHTRRKYYVGHEFARNYRIIRLRRSYVLTQI